MVLLTTVESPTGGIRHQQDNTCATVGDNDVGKGCLYITESCVTWLNDGGQGFTLCYPSISLHAISRDAGAYPKPCLYVMFDGKLGASSDDEDDKEDENETSNDPVSDFTEIRFVPDDVTALDSMYNSLCDCQILHPDADDSFSEDDDDDEYEAGENEVTPGSVIYQSDLNGSASVAISIHGDGNVMETDAAVDEGQFEDVDEK